MNKQELRDHTKRMLLLGVLVGALIATISFGLPLALEKNKNTQLVSDYNWLSDSADSCWSRLRELDNTCWSPSDCARNNSLNGCSKIDCNYCCDGMCTLMYCGYLDKYTGDVHG